MATIKKTGTGQWTVRGVVTYQDGSTKDIRRAFNRLAKAKEFAAGLTTEQASPVAAPAEISFADYYDRWITTYKLGKHSDVTDTWYTLVGGYIRQYFHDTLISGIDRASYQKFLDWCATTPRGKREQPLSRTTVSRINSYIKAVVLDAVEDGYTRRDFTRRAVVSGTPSKPASEKYVDAGELEKMVSIAERHASLEAMSYYVVIFQALTGARFEEALGMTWECVNFDQHTVTFKRSWLYKNKKRFNNFGPLKNVQSYRTIPISTSLLAVLSQLRQEQRKAYLAVGYRDTDDLCFRKADHSILTNNAVNDTVRRLCKWAGTKNSITSHGLRHSHGSMLLYKGVSILAISRRLGHASVNITMKVYLHEVDEMKQKDDQQTLKALNEL
ncbi:tyrosine-type recombinase/integrase [Lacticaseibacillus mingshuiensis]|uniref:Tyrosine-type recombinase/integrase n=1 Tax=Lacticaseibacillus mingshuiensis TaxID=2799574 RepID=A0ABW4CG35_9LACO|nr:site-specific integrase [Lacticaseibacillus mingshuiensis]